MLLEATVGEDLLETTDRFYRNHLCRKTWSQAQSRLDFSSVQLTGGLGDQVD